MWWDNTLRNSLAYLSVYCMVPNSLGNYETVKTAVAWGSGNTVTGTVINADALQKVDGTGRLFACTATKIYEVTSSAVTDRSSGGGSYTTATEWNAAQYGDVSLYTSYTNNVQASSSGAFAALAGTPPKAKYIATQSLAVALAGYNDGVNTYLDGVWTSDIGDHTTWTPSASNEAANFRLLQTPGPITAIVAFKGDFIAFKDNSIYRLSYVGLPVIWQVQLINDSIGAASQGSVCICRDRLIFGGASGWHAFDGQRIMPIYPISSGFGQLSTDIVNSGPLVGPSSTMVASFYDPVSGLAHFNSSNGNSGNVYAIQTADGEGFGFFGVYTVFINGSASSPTKRCMIRGYSQALTAAGIGSGFSYQAFFLASSTDSVPYTMSGAWDGAAAGVSAFLQTAYLGNAQTKTYWSRVIPLLCYRSGYHFASGTLVGKKSEIPMISFGVQTASVTCTGAPMVIGGTDISRFDIGSTSRFMSFRLQATEPFEVEDLIIESKSAGKE